MEILKKGWGVVVGVPTIFLAAYLYPLFPGLWDLPTCAVRHFLGVKCPGCGLTTSFGYLAHLEFRRSVDCHPLGAVIAVWLLYMFARNVWGLASGRMPPTILKGGRGTFVAFVFLVALIFHWAYGRVVGP
jgi:hypothetical protein